ncbi:transketolase C-terminal domain-containing protein [Lysinibacillus louembei]|uniref:Transketolase C-terminal domain-containing protein n=1 Tax=Lysinibacillus louembei TaxID=1470088 RepID=A0ABZ0RZG9_9BACI|nr:transketolase C-terminal domain-containing protein [Lysinibacillus louembei]WPK12394.1 transketolase C-terminal domain-containing protein [Lysinibacillus louembei]
MRNTFINVLIEEAKKDDRICLITPDMGYSVVENFQTLFPDRFFNVGIAEQNAVGVAAGLALSGKIVYVYSIVPFVTMRCFEQIRVDVAYMNTNVRLIGIGAGLSYGPAGATHHSIEDIAIMRALPNMTVCCPGDPVEVKEIIKQSVLYNGPMYIRLGKNGEPNIHPENQKIEIGKGIKMTEGDDLMLITTSNMLEQGQLLVKELLNEGKRATLISMPTIKPFDSEIVIESLKNHTVIYTLEEHSKIGGLGSAVAEVIAENGLGIKLKRIGINDEFTHKIGSQNYLRKKLIFDNVEIR